MLKLDAKKLFKIIASLGLVLMIWMSYTAGISGDEVRFDEPHGEKVYNYYKSLGKDRALFEEKYEQRYYGIFFNNIASSINQIFDIDSKFETRRIVCGIVGWMLLLFCALIIKEIYGWKAAIVCFVLGFLSPRLMGHSFNNLKDIPFAFSFAMSFYYFIRVLKNLPKPKTSDLIWAGVGIGLSIGSRIGGLLTIPYLLLISFLYFTNYKGNDLKAYTKKETYLEILNLLKPLGIILAVGYVVTILFWPYALENPLDFISETFKVMEHYSVSIGQIFEGTKIPSAQLPWYYLPKMFWITTPLVVIVGAGLSFISLKHFKTNKLRVYLWFFFLFVTVFPIAFIIYNKSNVYGGIRHTLFVLVGLVILAAMGWSELYCLIKENKTYKWITVGVFSLLAFLPLKHYFMNHPYQYIYFNEILGGMDEAYGNYETDYYYHTVKEATIWLKENEIKTSDTLVVASNHDHIVRNYLRDMKSRVSGIYSRYYERSDKDWNYYICCIKTVSAEQIQDGVWPPKNTIHTIDVDGKPMCAIIKRTSKKDLEGIKKQKAGDISGAVEDFQTYLKSDPTNIDVLNKLTGLYMQNGNLAAAKSFGEKSLKSYRNNYVASFYMARIYFNQQNFRKTIQMSNNVLKSNPRSIQDYYLLGASYANLGNMKNAQKYLNICVGQKFKPGIQLMIQLLQKNKQHKQAQQLQKYLQSI